MSVRERFQTDGVVSPIRVVTEDEAAQHRSRMEAAERAIGPLHYRDKVHTVLTSPFELATHPHVLDAVEEMIGPDILLYNATYIVKEPGAPSFVAWHQDLTYWGLAEDDAQVSMWLALAPATRESGCMSMLPGSHRRGAVAHDKAAGDDNVLLMGQRIDNVDDSDARLYPLAPGEASFHHGWTLHTSAPNVSNDRRIGLNVQYLAPHNRHSGDDATALLVRGQDRFGYFGEDSAPSTDLDPTALAAWNALDAAMKAGFTSSPAT